MQSKAPSTETSFQDLGLSDAILKALTDVGYETPSPIQARTIPHILAGTDVLGQAQTGTGKTAACSRRRSRHPLQAVLYLLRPWSRTAYVL